MVDVADLLARIMADATVDLTSSHGPLHWSRVERNGLYLSETSGADRDIVSLFAFLHDCQRLNDDLDPEHGPRAAEYARTLRGSHIHLDDARFELLYEACARHTHGLASEAWDDTIATCWDADRLDLWRVGIRPKSFYLATATACRIADEDRFDHLEAQPIRTLS